MSDRMAYTHIAWFGFCPAYFAELDDGSVVVERRHWLLTPVWVASEFMLGCIISALSLVDPGYEPMWAFWRLKPIRREVLFGDPRVATGGSE